MATTINFKFDVGQKVRYNGNTHAIRRFMFDTTYSAEAMYYLQDVPDYVKESELSEVPKFSEGDEVFFILRNTKHITKGKVTLVCMHAEHVHTDIANGEYAIVNFADAFKNISDIPVK